jgi:phosphoribosylformylglycinamidine synthase
MHAGDAILQIWPIPRGERPNPDLKVPFEPEPMRYYAVDAKVEPVPDVDPEAPEAVAARDLAVFGSSEFAKVVLGSLWGRPPVLDLGAEADLHTLLGVLAKQKLLHSARDISDGGISVSLAQACFGLGIGARVDQDPSLMVYPLFGLFAEPATTVIVTAAPSNVDAIEELAREYSFIAVRVGTTGGDRLEITVDREPFISAPLAELRPLWAESLEATLHDQVAEVLR